MSGSRRREYLATHPWIDFDARVVNGLNPESWMLIGQAQALCTELAGTPLKPAVAHRLSELTLIRGAQATVAIEGNTLTEEQVAGIRAGTYAAPPSRAYQEREVQNILVAFERLDDIVMNGDSSALSASLVCDLNRWVLDGVNPDADSAPGSIRTHSVVVGNYVGAPARDCRYLLEQLAEWLDGETFRPPLQRGASPPTGTPSRAHAAADGREPANDPTAFARCVASALLAHLYIAWIHPFADGNGRTARLLEYLILARSGMVPLPAANLMANHFNLTRDRYYRRLEAASRERDTVGFLNYGIEGLVDGLVEHTAAVREQHLTLAWESYVNEVMSQFPNSPASERQQALVMALPPGDAITRADLAGLTPVLAQKYARTGPRTLARDLNKLHSAGLIAITPDGVSANVHLLAAFLQLTPA